MELIEIKCMVSLTLRPRTYRQLTVFQPLVNYSQSVLSTQTPEFEDILNQRVKARMTHLVVHTKRITIEMAKLHRLYIELKS